MRTFRHTILVAIFSNLPTDCLAVSIESRLPECTGTQYLDAMAFACTECGAGRVADAAGRACICAEGYAALDPDDLATCTACDDGYRPNKDGTACLRCGDTMEDRTLTTALGEVTLCDCAGSDAPRTKALNPFDVEEVLCVECPAGEYPGPDWECKRCEDFGKVGDEVDGEWQCKCGAGYQEAGEGCVATADWQQLRGKVEGDVATTTTMVFRSVVGDE